MKGRESLFEKYSLSSIESMGSASLPAEVCWLFRTVSSIVIWVEKEELLKSAELSRKKEKKNLKKWFGLVLHTVTAQKMGSKKMKNLFID